MLSILGYGKTFLCMISKQENHKEDWVVLENKSVKCMGEKPSTKGQINYEGAREARGGTMRVPIECPKQVCQWQVVVQSVSWWEQQDLVLECFFPEAVQMPPDWRGVCWAGLMAGQEAAAGAEGGGNASLKTDNPQPQIQRDFLADSSAAADFVNTVKDQARKGHHPST